MIMSKIKFIAIFAVLIMTCALWSPVAQAAPVKTSKGYNYSSKTTAMPLRGHRHHWKHHCHRKHWKHHHKHHKD